MLPSQPIPIHTIGYGSRTIDELIATLQHYGIAWLVDVRSAPYSRFKPEFSKRELETVLQENGIRYLFMGDTLGGRPESEACYTDGQVDYEKVKRMDFYQQGISRIQTAFVRQQRIALMCSEGKPEECHRSRLIGATLSDLGIPLLHIDENDEAQSQEAVIYRLTKGQLSLFDDEPTFRSRKRYQKAEPEA